MPRTRRVDCSGPGIARVRRGRGFAYVHADGARVMDAATIDRIRALAIPPAWRDVWICTDPRGHIQATGIDAAGRKQYRYHDDWRRRRDQAKFDAMVAFAQALPALRRRVARDLADADDGAGGLGEARVLACAVRLLDVGLFRVGGEDYAAQNETYGLTTLRRAHVRVERDGLLFDFPAKHGVRRVQRVCDGDVRPVVAALKRRRGGGEELLAWRRPSGSRSRWVDVKAEDVNAYLKEAAGGDFSAKDFRTWNATALCAVALAVRAQEATSRTARRRLVKAAIDEVATFLGNTPAVARGSYVDPRVIDRFHEGLTVAAALAAGHEPLDADEPVPEHSVSERVRRAVLDLIAGEEDAPGVDELAAAA
ncbi:MAG: DNA topoisomerase IB [Actinobacteria bacterium]|nr:DNA topoisomerase IB [Actinomycetota bacterium]